MRTHDSAVTTRKDGQLADEKRESARSLGLPFEPPSRLQQRLAKVVGAAWVTLVAIFLLHERWLTFMVPCAVLVGAVAGATYPRSSLRATLGVVLFLLGVCFVESKGTMSYLMMAVLVSLPVVAPLLWIGAWASAVAMRHLRTRHLRPC